MRLNSEALKSKQVWEQAGVEIPKFDRKEMIRLTAENPTWVHFGAGNIFRAYPAALQQLLLDKGIEKTGIVVVEGYDPEIIEKVFLPYDNLTMLVTLKADGTINKTVVGSIAEALAAKDIHRLREIFRSKSLQMASFTITEKGYNLTSPDGKYFHNVQEDFTNGPSNPTSYIGLIASLCHERYIAVGLPLAMVSMDNCSHNGDKLFAAVHTFAQKWSENGHTDKQFPAYIADKSKVSFPWSMIDKITPRPDDSVKEMLQSIGFQDTVAQVTSKNTYISPFVNAEEAQYLVIEDSFPNGRPALDKVGVLFTDRATVDNVEKMKVCTCLNPLHTALAIFGCLLGYNKISDEMKDSDLVKLVETVGYKEGLPVVVDPKVLSPKKFIDEVLQVRLPNPFMPDTPQRIATDTSLKIPIRFGETIKAYLASETLDTKDLKLIPLALAGWIRYLMGVDDNGNAFTVSSDPIYESLKPLIEGIKLGDKKPFHEQLQPILSNSDIFAVDLYKAGLGDLVESYFAELVSAKGAVRITLHKYVMG